MENISYFITGNLECNMAGYDDDSFMKFGKVPAGIIRKTTKTRTTQIDGVKLLKT